MNSYIKYLSVIYIKIIPSYKNPVYCKWFNLIAYTNNVVADNRSEAVLLMRNVFKSEVKIGIKNTQFVPFKQKCF